MKKLKTLLKRFKEWIYPVGTLTSPINFLIDTDYSIWVSDPYKNITLWWYIDKPFWKFNCGERMVINKFSYDHVYNRLYSFGLQFSSVAEAEIWASEHKTLGSLYRFYISNKESIEERSKYKKWKAHSKRERALAKQFNKRKPGL